MDEQRGRLIGGRYDLQERIGRGGLGVVYRALDGRLGRTVAVKLLNEQVADDPAAIQRLENEARTTASLTSQHVVQVYDFGTDDGRPYLVMEYLPGGTLASHLAGKLPLAADQIVDYGRQIAAGLAAAHARGLIHRDVTLRNVLVGNDGRLKVTDFGIAKLAGGPSLTQTGLTMGTALSMAPEQARGQAVTPATDVYGLGVLLYELAAGRPPFTGTSDVEVALQHVQTPPTPPVELNPALPGWLNEVILRALAKEPAARYPDGAAIGAALAHGPVGAPALPAAAAASSLAAGATTAIPEVVARPAPPVPVDLPLTRPIRTMEAPGGLPAGTTTALPEPAPAASPLPAEQTTVRQERRRPLLLPLLLLPLLLVGGLLLAARARGSDTSPPGTATAPPSAAVATAVPTAVPNPRVSPTAAPTTVAAAAPPTATTVPASPTAAPATATTAPVPTPPPPTATAAPAPAAVEPKPPVPTATQISPTATPAPAPAAKPGEKGNNGREDDDDEKKKPRKRGQVDLDNTAFAGGFSNPDGSVYADSTGERRTATWIYGGQSEYPEMRARFRLDEVPDEEVRLAIIGMDGEDAGKMPLRISINDTVIYQGEDPLPDNRWAQAIFRVPVAALRAGENTLAIRSLSRQANFKTPHFFMLDAARLEWGDGASVATVPAPAAGGLALDNTAFSGGLSYAGESLYADASGERRTALWIYGARSQYPAMAARFRLDVAPAGEARLILIGMDAEGAARMPIRVGVNDTAIFEGDNPLPDWRWGQATLRVPAGILQAGENTLAISSLAPTNNINSPPFFMLDAARLEWDA